MAFEIPSEWQSRPPFSGQLIGSIDLPLLALSSRTASTARVSITSTLDEPLTLVALDSLALVFVAQAQENETWFRFQGPDPVTGWVTLAARETRNWEFAFVPTPPPAPDIVQLIAERGIEEVSRMRPEPASVAAPRGRSRPPEELRGSL